MSIDRKLGVALNSVMEQNGEQPKTGLFDRLNPLKIVHAVGKWVTDTIENQEWEIQQATKPHTDPDSET
jgi:hypothetical protein